MVSGVGVDAAGECDGSPTFAPAEGRMAGDKLVDLVYCRPVCGQRARLVRHAISGRHDGLNRG